MCQGKYLKLTFNRSITFNQRDFIFIYSFSAKHSGTNLTRFIETTGVHFILPFRQHHGALK